MDVALRVAVTDTRAYSDASDFDVWLRSARSEALLIGYAGPVVVSIQSEEPSVEALCSVDVTLEDSVCASSAMPVIGASSSVTLEDAGMSSSAQVVAVCYSDILLEDSHCKALALIANPVFTIAKPTVARSMSRRGRGVK